MAKYIKCANCGSKIKFGEDVCRLPGDANLCCSAECLGGMLGAYVTLDAYTADICYCQVYDDDARKLEIEKEIEEACARMESLLKEFAALKE